MQNFASLNTPILNYKGAKAHRSPMSLVVVGFLALIIGLVFWFVSQDKPAPVYDDVSQQDRLRSEVASLLENAQSQASEAEINRITYTLSQTKSSATQSDRDSMAAMLENF